MQITDAINPLFLILCGYVFPSSQTVTENWVKCCWFDDKLDVSSLGLLLALFPTP